MIFLSVIIPCYNELENLKRGVLAEVTSYLSRQNFDWEIVISDDGSSDGSFELVEKYIKGKKHFVHLRNPKGGKAFALRAGINKAKGKYVLFTDMDQSTPIDEFEKYKEGIEHGYEIVIGSRGFKSENYPFVRKIASPIFLLIRRALVLSSIHDTQCGFKCFRTDVVKKVFSKLEVFRRQRGSGWRVGAWDVELLFVAQRMNFKIKEITVEWRNIDSSTSKQRKFVQESVEMLREIIRVRKNEILGIYD